MKLALFKVNIKNNRTLFFIILYVMLMYFTMITYMYDPTDSSALMDMMDLLPSGLVAGLGFDAAAASLTGHVVNFYYGFLIFIFPMIYCIVVANRLVSKMVDNGSFAYLLMSPTSRRTIICTQGIFLLLSIGLLFTVLHICGILVCRTFFGNMLNESTLLQININAGLLTMTVGMICFFYSCYFNESRLALSFSAAVNIGFLLLFTLGGVSEKSEFLKDISLYSLLNSTEILQGGGTAGVGILLLCIIVILFFMSIFVFERKNLPI